MNKLEITGFVKAERKTLFIDMLPAVNGDSDNSVMVHRCSIRFLLLITNAIHFTDATALIQAC